MENKEIKSLFLKKKALLKGHFSLSSGLHSGVYLQSGLILQYPDLAEKLARMLVTQLPPPSSGLRRASSHLVTKSPIGVVVSPAIGGIVIGQEVARVLGCRAIFSEREKGKMTLRRGFAIKKKEKILVIEDVITTGGSTQEVIEVVKNGGGKVVAIGCLVDRSDGRTKFAYPLISLLKLEIENYAPQNCPLCKKNIPLVKPGSRKRSGKTWK